MVGCQGTVAYVFMPWSQVASNLTDRDGAFKINARPYHLDASKRLLTRQGLPAVGETVTLNISSVLLSHDQLSQEVVRTEIRKDWLQFDKQTREASLYAYDFSTLGSLMRAGAQIKILSYEGDAAFGNSSLFALVQVEAD